MFTTRIAPSPTGDMHLGTARTAYFNWLAARASGGKFILRIDDTDAARSKYDHIRTIFDVMDWLGLNYDLTFRQSDRTDLYRDLAAALTAAGLAYHDDGAIRLRHRLAAASWPDTIAGDVAISDRDNQISDGLVILRSDGLPTYHFASVVDDMDTRVNWVIRGADHISNTAKQLAIWDALNQVTWSGTGAVRPQWSHVGLIHLNGRKLAKRDGAASMLAYRDSGIDPDALLNFMLRLGWGPAKDDKTTAVLDRAAAITLFIGGGRMKSSAAAADLAKLASFDRKYKARQKSSVAS